MINPKAMDELFDVGISGALSALGRPIPSTEVVRDDRSVSWVSRRLALVELLLESIQQQVREGKIAAQVAMKFLVPVARQNLEDCQRMAAMFAEHHCNTSEAGQLYGAWRRGYRIVFDEFPALRAFEQHGHQRMNVPTRLRRQLQTLQPILHAMALTRAIRTPTPAGCNYISLASEVFDLKPTSGSSAFLIKSMEWQPSRNYSTDT